MKRRFLYIAALVMGGSLAACDGAPSRGVHVFDMGLHSDSQTGAILVRRSDTLYSIAQRYRLPVREVIDLNGLSPPYALAENQRLKLPPPVDYRVREGDTLQSVTSLFAVSMSQFVAVNQIQPPFRLKPGQVLRIPSAARLSSPPSESSQVAAIKNAPPGAVKKSSVPARAAAAVPQTTISPPRRSGFVWPVRGKVISAYGPKGEGLYNDGINIAAPKGAAVAAAADGVVAYVGSGLKSYGNLVLIRHGDGFTTAYAHLSSISVAKGAPVQRGQVIGATGSTGSVSTPQLHFEIRQRSKTFDPLKYL